MYIKGLITVMILSIAVECNATDPPKASAKVLADGKIGGHEYVDLGLPSGTLWATCNIGASSPYESGDYFAWGETEARVLFNWDNYKFLKDYIYDPSIGVYADLENIGENICGTQYDAAAQQWGNGWRLPNDEETYELRMYCWGKWTTEEGMNGMRIYGPNENSIFIPASGYRYIVSEIISDYGNYGGFMSGIEAKDDVYSPTMYCSIVEVQHYSSQLSRSKGYKCVGRNVRPVINPREVTGISKSYASGDNVKVSYRNGEIVILGVTAPTRLTICDLSGKTLFESSVADRTVSLPSLAPGVYIVKMTNQNYLFKTQKITIK